jgi:hypothetical protein
MLLLGHVISNSQFTFPVFRTHHRSQQTITGENSENAEFECNKLFNAVLGHKKVQIL